MLKKYALLISNAGQGFDMLDCIFYGQNGFSRCVVLSKVSSYYSSYFTDKVSICRPPGENYFLYFSSKTYVVGTQKNRRNETVLLSTQNTCLN